MIPVPCWCVNAEKPSRAHWVSPSLFPPYWSSPCGTAQRWQYLTLASPRVRICRTCLRVLVAEMVRPPAGTMTSEGATDE